MATKKDTTKVPKGFKKLTPTQESSSNNKEWKWDPRPSIDFKQDDLPEMKEWEVGKDYTIEVRVKMERYSSSMNSESGKTETGACFRILGVKAEAEEE